MDQDAPVFEPSKHAASSSALKGGYEYEYQISLRWIIRLFTEGKSSQKLYFDQRHVYPFDDLVIARDTQITLHQLKSNSSGTLDALVSSLKDKKGKYDKATTPSHPSLVVAFLGENPPLPEQGEYLGWKTYELTQEFAKQHELSDCLAGCHICSSPALTELSKENEQWFLDRYGDQGLRIYLAALESVRDIWNASSGIQRSVDQVRALWLLGLETHRVKHNVHNVAGLLKRSALIDELEKVIGDGNVILLGQPGSGKSALLDLLVDRVADIERHRVLRYSFFVGPSDSFRNERLGYDFAIREIFQADMAFVSRLPVHVTEAQVLNRLKGHPEGTTIIVDGLDHLGRASSDELERLGRFLGELANLQSIRLLVSAQVEEQLPNTLPKGAFAKFAVPALRVQETNQLVKLITGYQTSDRCSELLTDKCEGNPLLLTYLLNLVEVADTNEYELEQQLTAVDMGGDVIDYLRRLLEGLEDRELSLLWYLAYFRFGFSLGFLKQVAIGLGIVQIDVGALWRHVRHVFKPVGHERFLAWHYSLTHILERELSIVPINALPDLHGIVQKLDDSPDRAIYSPLLTIDNAPQDIAHSIEELRNCALEGRIRAHHAEAIALDAIKVLAKQGDLAQMIKSLFIRSEFVVIIDALSHTDTPVNQAIANAASNFRKPSLLYPETGLGVIKELKQKEGLLAIIRSHPELQWIIDKVQPTMSFEHALVFGLEILRGFKTIQDVADEFAKIQWGMQDRLEEPWRKATDEEVLKLEEGAFFDIGRILARQLTDDDVYTTLASFTPQNDRDARLVLLSACAACEARSDYMRTRELAIAALKPVLASNIRFWHLADMGDEEARGVIENLVDQLDFEQLAKSASSEFPNEEQSFNSKWSTLLSALVAAERIGRKGLVLRALREMELLPHDGGVGEAAIMREVCDHAVHGKDIHESIRQCLADGIKRFDLGHMGGMLTRAFDLGLIELSDANHVMWALSLGNRHKYDALGVVETRAKSFSTEQRSDVREHVLESMSGEPHSWVNQASRVATLYTVAGEVEDGEDVASDALSVLGIYGYHKEMTYNHMLNVVRMVAYAGLVEDAKSALARIGGYLPTIDVVTDGDHTEYWFQNLMSFTFEDCEPKDSTLLSYVLCKVNSGDYHRWYWRIGNLFSAQIENVSGLLRNSWIAELLAWFKKPEVSADSYTFKKWAFGYTQTDTFRCYSEHADETAGELLSYARADAEELHKAIEQGFRPDGRYDPRFEDYIRTVEKAIGLPTVFEDKEYPKPDESEAMKSDSEAKSVSLPSGLKLDEFMTEKMFWYPDWYGCNTAYRTAIADELRKSGADAPKLICSSLAIAAEVSYFDASAMAVGMAWLNVYLGQMDKLTFLLDQLIEYFERRFTRLAKDEAFSQALKDVSFHSLSINC